MVRNAGVVLLWPLLRSYFARLELLDGDGFAGAGAQERAVALTHYLATGLTLFEERDLLLCKVLCGLPPEAPAPLQLELDEQTRALSEGLLEFVIKSWPAVGSLSVQGLRGSFLCRDGQLSGDAERWTLAVEWKAYDLLLGSWPWPLSVVKLPWMPEPLFVHWRR